MSDEMSYPEAMEKIEEVAKFHLKQGHGKYSRDMFRALGAIREEHERLESAAAEARAAVTVVGDAAYEAGRKAGAE